MLLPESPMKDPGLLSPLDLAFVGDGVYGLLVRGHLASRGSAPVGRLHAQAVELVRAGAQSDAYGRIAPALTPEEEAVYQRGRNAHSVRPPKNTDPAVYRRATGLEALFGYLYLAGREERLRELFALILEGADGDPGKNGSEDRIMNGEE